ncbi:MULTISPECIES: bifunctional 2-polyprenyl-6-hydroxyphenol methylase/3-demethylubiquinol 3-O-methyltransferase UbiG [unclassified Cupriavidus]|uniref:class I SAM-dependent methyltransferase n=1 Tax=unclassified Cupriavidus TaxID=2640874 RepID=UPI0010F89164|nr:MULTISPECIES: class I SAM-dependent methyltransferase [unclassified Cupriavidus]MWL86822.1 methyltransferase domain-containing protein [Cupriavidus sp. SW-Y-13]
MTLLHPTPVPPTVPSPWLVRWTHLIQPGGRVLDLACGNGRHASWLAEQGFRVLAVDRDAEAIARLPASVQGRVADLELGSWPLADAGTFDAIVVTNYLHRPLWAHLLDALAPRGVLIYETFAAGNETIGKPSRPEFLLKPGELLDVTHGRLRVVGFEDGLVESPKLAFVQRICAVSEAGDASGAAAPPRYRLPG